MRPRPRNLANWRRGSMGAVLAAAGLCPAAAARAEALGPGSHNAIFLLVIYILGGFAVFLAVVGGVMRYRGARWEVIALTIAGLIALAGALIAALLS